MSVDPSDWNNKNVTKSPLIHTPFRISIFSKTWQGRVEVYVSLCVCVCCFFFFVRKALLHLNYHFGPRQQRVGSHPYIWKKVNSGKWMAVSLLPLNNKHVHFSVDIRSSINMSGASRWLSGKNHCQGSIPELGRSPGEGKGNPLQYSCLENPMDRGGELQFMGWQKSWTPPPSRDIKYHLRMSWDIT